VDDENKLVGAWFPVHHDIIWWNGSYYFTCRIIEFLLCTHSNG